MTVSTKVSTKIEEDLSSWELAARVAESELQALGRKQARLRQAVRIFRANDRDGVPWPTDSQGGED